MALFSLLSRSSDRRLVSLLVLFGQRTTTEAQQFREWSPYDPHFELNGLYALQRSKRSSFVLDSKSHVTCGSAAALETSSWVHLRHRADRLRPVSSTCFIECAAGLRTPINTDSPGTHFCCSSACPPPALA
ncbi:hypothetical protein HDK77DRAFT_452130 [Phyllosticta capitalensis]